MDTEQTTLEVTVDKSHIVTIGERLYGESIELIRELVNNAYDADASEVKLTIKDDKIIVEDDGLGMDLDGLRQYFNIGSTLKRKNPKSPKFARDRIGEFGIGKFASLSACSCFEVWTKKDDFQARVVFDKEEWNRSKDKWHIPLEIEKPDHRLKNGARVTLEGVTKKFNILDIERRIIESVPIKAQNFSVYLNGSKISARIVPGHRIPFMEGTEYGIIHGEIIVSPQMDQDMSDAGIECKVKQVTITKDFFSIDKLVKNIARIKGEVNADFLPITSDRTNFIKDTPQYKKFIDVMALVVDRIKNALILNPDYCPDGLIPFGDETSETGQPGYIQPVKAKTSDEESKELKTELSQKKKRQRKPKVKQLTPTAVIKKLKLGQQGISCCIDHLGTNGPECVTEGAIVYINRDHPLYKQESQNRNTFILHIARLLTQEICLMKDPRNPRQAFLRQSRLLQDALVDSENKNV